MLKTNYVKHTLKRISMHIQHTCAHIHTHISINCVIHNVMNRREARRYMHTLAYTPHACVTHNGR